MIYITPYGTAGQVAIINEAHIECIYFEVEIECTKILMNSGAEFTVKESVIEMGLKLGVKP